MVFNQFRQLPDFPANMNAGSGIRDLDGLEDGRETFITLKLFGHASDLQGAGVEGLQIFWGAKPGVTQLKHCPPVQVHSEYNEEGDGVGNYDMSDEKVATHVANGKHAEDVAFALLYMLEVVDNIDRNEDTTCEHGNAREQPA